MKLKEAVSWLTGTLQCTLFSGLEECCERPLTEKEQRLTSILSLVAMEPFADRTCPQRFGRERRERRAIACMCRVI